MNAKELHDWFAGPGRIIPIPISGMDAEDKHTILLALSLLAAAEANDGTTPETDAEAFDDDNPYGVNLQVVPADLAKLRQHAEAMAKELESIRDLDGWYFQSVTDLVRAFRADFPEEK